MKTILMVLAMTMLAACGDGATAGPLGSKDNEAAADVGASEDASGDAADARAVAPDAAPDVREASPAPDAGSADVGADVAQDDAADDASPPDAGDPCTGQRDGTKVGDAGTMVCCSGVATDITTTSNCGVCGLRCDIGSGARCAEFDSQYYACLGCSGDMSCSGLLCVNMNNSAASSVCEPSRTGSCGVAQCPDGSTCVVDLGMTFCIYP